MLVDDSELALASLTRWMRKYLPLQVLGQAADGQQGYDLACALRPDLVITDLNMPRLDGFRLAEMLRQEYPEMKLIITSSDESPTVIAASRRRGADAFIPKFRLPEELAGAIRRLFPRLAEIGATCAP